MQIIRQQFSDGFVMYSIEYKGQFLMHFDLVLLLEDIYNYFGINLKPYLFGNFSLN